MIPVDIKNVIVLSQYRSGSTALCNFLGKKFKLKDFGEIFHVDTAKSKQQEYLNSFNTIPSVIKIPGNNIDQIPKNILKNIWSKSFTIRLTRKNFLLQSISWYSANATDCWTSLNLEKNYLVPILPRSVTDKWIKNLHFQNHYIQSLIDRIDLECCYEDLNLTESSYKKISKPLNYDRVYDHVNKSVRRTLDSCLMCNN